ncbi:MAG: DMT family transporter [Clostridiales bacterium]|nr:DMT family transporter [Clostridiales bacterium]
MNKQKMKGNFLLLITAFVWGVSFISQSKGVETISPCAFNGIRSVLGGLVLLPVIAVTDIIRKRKGIEVQKLNKKLVAGGIICGALLCAASTVQTAGMVYTSPGKAGFITALYMIIVPIIGLLTGKRPRPAILLAVLIATAGLYLMCIDSKLTINKGDVMVLVCAFLFAGHILAIDYFSPRVDGVKLACLQFFVCGIINLIWVLLFENPQLEPILGCSIAIGYSGIMSCGVAYTLQIVGQKYTDPTSASILMSLESVFAVLATVVLVACGWELTGGALTAREITGCVLMFAAIILVQLPETNDKK